VEEEQEETLLHATQNKNVDMEKVKGKEESECACWGWKSNPHTVKISRAPNTHITEDTHALKT